MKEKLLAAGRGGIKTVLIPEENVKDLAEIPDEIKNRLDIHPVRWIEQVLEQALERQPTPLADDKEASGRHAASARARERRQGAGAQALAPSSAVFALATAAREQRSMPTRRCFFRTHVVARSINADSSITSARYLRRNANRARILLRVEAFLVRFS